jgi:hypothetical protein
MNGYELSRYWFDWAFENPDLINANDTALYMWLIEKNNRCGWSEKFSISSTESMSACGFKTYPPYKKSFDRLIELGFVIMVKKSINQFQSNVIALSKNNKAIVKALDKASLTHSIKHVESNSESTFDINKQETIKPEKPQTENNIFNFLTSIIGLGVDKQTANDWMIVRNKKKAANTLTAFDGIVREIKKTNLTPNEIIKLCAEKSWISFKSEWVKPVTPQKRLHNHGIPVN